MSTTMPPRRDDLVKLNIIHEFDRVLAIANLRGCYGRIAERFYSRMIRDVKGTRILDAGCGFGQFSSCCVARGLSVHSVDIDERSLAVARDVYQLKCFNESTYQTSLPDNSIDTVVSNDAICHFDIERFLCETRRLGAQRIIVHDSNIENPFLVANRRLMRHEEYRSYSAFDVVNLFQASGYKCVKLDFVNFLSLPISGGFQRRPLPVVSRFPAFVYAIDSIIARALTVFAARQKLAFRFVAVFERA